MYLTASLGESDDKATANYLSCTKHQADKLSNRLVNIMEHLVAVESGIFLRC